MRNLKRALSLALAAMMLIGMMVVSAGAASKDFTDKDEITHTEAVNTLVALNVIAGKGDGSAFDPTGTLTRAEMAKLVTYVLNGGVEIALHDLRGEEPVGDTFRYEGGIREYVAFINSGKTPIAPEVIYCQGAEEVTLVSGEKLRIYCEVALQWTDYYNSDGIYSFCNNISTKEGGTHVEGFNLALNRVINEYARKAKLLGEKDPNLATDDCREGLTCVISAKHPNPQYEGQTKTKLGNSEVRKIVFK